VNVVKTEFADKFVEQVRHEYEKATGIRADCFVSSPSDGALALAAKGGAA
jgi:galactokinase